MTSLWKPIFSGLMMLALASVLACVGAPAAHAALGDQVVNVATVSQDTPAGRAALTTNPAIFTIEARETPSQIDFFRIAPGAPDAVPTMLNGSDYSPSSDPNGAFTAIGTVMQFGQTPLDTSAPLPLIPADTYLSGELMVVRVMDMGQNGDPNAIETVIITVLADNGDRITLRLYESGPDTGEFFAYFPSTADPTALNDIVITAPQDTVLTATYIDAFDATEVSVDTALVDPYGRVFDSFTGALINGVTVTIVDAASGLPASVFGIDGVSSYPSTLVSGEVVTDSSGRTYDLADGEFLFPLMVPGNYQLVIGAPGGYLFPSVRPAADFVSLPNAPFEIIPGSYGSVFTVTGTGPLNLDVPLDPNGDLIARKEASESTASIGDFIGYSVELENGGNVPAPFNLHDNLPLGLRYVAGTARLDGVEIPDPYIGSNGRSLTFGSRLVMPGQTVRLSYLTAVGPGTPEGELVNTAVAMNNNGEALSNVAEAAVIIEEDLLRSRLTIVGRVADAACSPTDDWARPLQDGKGIEGVRLYMETGRYVVTDADGLYHFEGIKPGTHVVQVDEATLPQGYDPVICEENTRYAGSALSKFVDAQGGTIWRANFYLKRNGEELEAIAEHQARVRDEDIFNQVWLDALPDATPHWAYPASDNTPDGRSVSLGFVHDPKQPVALKLNGRAVSGLNFSGIELSADRTVAMSRWSGVDIQRGANEFVAEIIDADGNVISRHSRTVWFVDEVHRAHLIADRTLAVADGRTKPVIAVRLEDSAGHPVHQGRLVEITVADPYRLAQTAEREFETPVTAAFSNVSGTRVGENGIALVELEPTLQSGRVRLQIELQDGRFEELDIWLQPEQREWVVVGLAEAEGLLLNIEDAGNDLNGDGRIAFFAKGLIKGDWLLTVAVDTAKRRGGRDGELFDEIDPNAYYTLYGDRTWQYNDAESRYPVYVKLERNTVQALFGDYETDLTDTLLGRYSRRLSGLKADYESERLSVTAFAAETNQSFVKDEIAADGTSGPFTLRSAPLIRSSESITVETRDRFRPDELISTRSLTRYVDYEIDYVTGELFFRHPVDATDSGFNQNVIVVDFETSSEAERNLTAGGRAAARFVDGAIETGLTVIHEEDGNEQKAGPSTLIAVDATIKLGEQTEIRAEAASSRAETELGDFNGNAWLIEATRRNEIFNVTGFYREESEGFGLGQQSSATSAIRRIGLQLGAELGIKEVAGGNDRSVRRVDAQIYREENLTSGTRRDVADVALRQDSQAFSASVGLRAIAEDFGNQAAPRQSVLLTSSVSKTFIDQGLTVSAAHEEPVYGGGANDDDATLFPGRTIIGVDKTLGRLATLSVRHESTNGGDAAGENTIVGINWAPRTGTQLRASTDMITQDGARRVGATVGVDQSWLIDENWSLGVGLASRRNVAGDDQPLDVTPDDALGPLENGLNGQRNSEAYTSGYIGAGYRDEKLAGSGRIELRKSDAGRRVVASLGGVREITQTLSFSAKARYQNEHLRETADSESLDIRVGTAWRPRGEGLIVLNRFDVGHDKVEGQTEKTKAVNNLAVNAMLTERTQLSIYHGIKYVETDFQGARASGFTNLIGAEARHDLTEKVDIGLHGFWTSGEASNTSAWAFGPSIGFTPKKNVWVSVGWNIEGFEDEDFEAAEYTRKGPYIKLRAKFDQDTFKGLIDRLGLGRD